MRQLVHTLTRRHFLLRSIATSLVIGNSKVVAQPLLDFRDGLATKSASDTDSNLLPERAKRVAEIIAQYDSQGIHRSGSEVDRVCALWLVERIQQLELEAKLEKFPLSRVDPVQAYIQIGQRRIEGIPVFDGTFTDANGVKGRLGIPGSDADISVVQISPNGGTAGDQELQSCRRLSQYKGIIAVTIGGRSGLAPINAPAFISPFGPPVLQVASEEAAWLLPAAKQGADAVLVAEVRRTDVNALNVTATLKGQQSSLAPLVVMTPRSGWWHCAGERGGGLACWLEVMKALCEEKPARDVVFVATSGHELGEMGLTSFLAQHSTLAKEAMVWLHFGANIGAAVGRGSILFASTQELKQMAVMAMNQADVAPNESFPPSHKPLGEALMIHNQGGRYISLLGRNQLFHHPEDRWPNAVDVTQVSRSATAFANLAITLTQLGNLPQL